VASWLASDLPADVHPSWRDQDWARAPLDELSGDPVTVAPQDCRDILELPDVLLEDDLE
jgi:hypothetical protein